MTKEQEEIYKQAEQYVSDKHPVKCVCGRLCTGLHELTCKKFRNAVNKEFMRRINNEN